MVFAYKVNPVYLEKEGQRYCTVPVIPMKACGKGVRCTEEAHMYLRKVRHMKVDFAQEACME